MTAPDPKDRPSVRTLFFEFATPEHPFTFRNGDVFEKAQLAYETYGELNEEKSNAILIFHALSGSHHVYGYNEEVEGIDLWTKEC